jgi:RNase H-like domain found in reverse transcriptase
MKALIAKETLLTFSDFLQKLERHMDASKLQLGACISQNGKPIAFYSRNGNQHRQKKNYYRTRINIHCGDNKRIPKILTKTKDQSIHRS